MGVALRTGRIARTTLELRLGDISKIAVDAIVNSANAQLSGGGGVDGAIHFIGGQTILEQCRIIGGCKTGDAVLTGAGNLPALYVIHAVAPRYTGKARDSDFLRSAYASALARAEDMKVKSVSFPSLGTGAYGYPIADAAPIALDTIARHVSTGRTSLERVVFVLFTDADYAVYEKLFPKR